MDEAMIKRYERLPERLNMPSRFLGNQRAEE